MEKTKLMEKFELKTGLRAESFDDIYMPEYQREFLKWVIEKAEAYDRLMSGGVITRQEAANLIGNPIAQNPVGSWFCFEKVPVFDRFGWFNGGGWVLLPFNIERIDVWHTSLTLPDGWEKK
ncbi:MAG: hypothetical protein ACQ5SW_12370 [Sphaerochaetaceae bacterium]